MGWLAYAATASATFLTLLGALGVLPVVLSVRAVRSTAPRRGLRLRVVQSKIALLVVLAPVSVYLGVVVLLDAHWSQPFALSTIVAGVVLAPLEVITYVRLEREIPDGQ